MWPVAHYIKGVASWNSLGIATLQCHVAEIVICHNGVIALSGIRIVKPVLREILMLRMYWCEWQPASVATHHLVEKCIEGNLRERGQTKMFASQGSWQQALSGFWTINIIMLSPETNLIFLRLGLKMFSFSLYEYNSDCSPVRHW